MYKLTGLGLTKVTHVRRMWTISKMFSAITADWVLLIRHIKQERWVIAKMNARCALYMGALAIFGRRQSLTTPTAVFLEIFNGLFPIEPMNVPPNFVFRSFTRSWDNMGTPKKFGQFFDTPTLFFLQNFNRLLFGWIMWMYWPNLKSVALPVPEIIAIGVLGGSCEPPVYRKKRPGA